MGREIRRVPANWEHPKDERGHFKPLYDESYIEALNKWWENHQLWLAGTHPDFEKYPDIKGKYRFYAEWNGDAPEYEYYRPEWTEPADHFQVYETVSEGTPTSPVFPTLEALTAWLVSQGYSQGAAENFAQRGWAPSMVLAGGRIFENIESAAIPQVPPQTDGQ